MDPFYYSTLHAFWVGTHATSPNSCYLTAAHRRQRWFFSLVNLGSFGGMRLESLVEMNTGYSCYLTAVRRCRGRFFFLVDLGPGAAVGGMRLEINRVAICNNSWHKMTLQSITELNSSCLCLSLSLSFPCICLFYLYYGYPDNFPKVFYGIHTFRQRPLLPK